MILKRSRFNLKQFLKRKKWRLWSIRDQSNLHLLSDSLWLLDVSSNIIFYCVRYVFLVACRGTTVRWLSFRIRRISSSSRWWFGCSCWVRSKEILLWLFVLVWVSLVLLWDLKFIFVRCWFLLLFGWPGHRCLWNFVLLLFPLRPEGTGVRVLFAWSFLSFLCLETRW